MMMGVGILGLVFMILFWGAISAGAIYLVRGLFPTATGPERSGQKQGSTAREVLDQRYALGEIDRESYELMKQDLLG